MGRKTSNNRRRAIKKRGNNRRRDRTASKSRTAKRASNSKTVNRAASKRTANRASNKTDSRARRKTVKKAGNNRAARANRRRARASRESKADRAKARRDNRASKDSKAGKARDSKDSRDSKVKVARRARCAIWANGLRQGNGSGAGSGDMKEMLDKLAQAENGASGQGKAGTMVTPGNGNCPGGDCGNMVTPGKDLKATNPNGIVGGGAGLGPRNNAKGVRNGGGVSDKKSRRTGDKRRYEDAWTDQLTATQKKLSKIKGKWGGSGEVEQLPTKGEGKGGQASTPLYDVEQSYKKDAEDAVSRESVPPAYKQPVKDYFDTFNKN